MRLRIFWFIAFTKAAFIDKASIQLHRQAPASSFLSHHQQNEFLLPNNRKRFLTLQIENESLQ
jgi:hypothetical protein